MAIDPVCEMEVDDRDTEFHSFHEGKEYYFCSEKCKNKFDKRPDDYADSSAA